MAEYGEGIPHDALGAGRRGVQARAARKKREGNYIAGAALVLPGHVLRSKCVNFGLHAYGHQYRL